jgi:hypothetical protein
MRKIVNTSPINVVKPSEAFGLIGLEVTKGVYQNDRHLLVCKDHCFSFVDLDGRIWSCDDSAKLLLSRELKRDDIELFEFANLREAIKWVSKGDK